VNYTPVKTVSARTRGTSRKQRRFGASKITGHRRRTGRFIRGSFDELAELAELLQAPVTTTLEGKSAFPSITRSLSAPAPA
jgi:hypothetical protein